MGGMGKGESVSKRGPFRSNRAAVLPALAALACWAAVDASAATGFPETGPSSGAHAVKLIREGFGSTGPCLTPEILDARGPSRSTVEHSLQLLRRRRPFVAGTAIEGPAGIQIRYATAPYARNRIDTTDADRDGRPDVLNGTLAGLEEAHWLFTERLGLPHPERLQVVLVELGPDLEGYTVPPTPRSPAALVLDATPREGAAGARRAAMHQYAHAVTLAMDGAFPVDWSEALAVWTGLADGGEPDATTAAAIDLRLSVMHRGLFDGGRQAAAGNAIWFAFVDESYGDGAVGLTVEELAGAAPAATAISTAVEALSGESFSAVFREFHLWTILVGPRADGHHFPFAANLAGPRFASASRGLPALAVHSDPPVAPFGAAQIRLEPEQVEGGLRIHFEGEFPARWETDLLLVGESGAVHRLALDASTDDGVEAIIPLDGLAEALLLVRNVGSEDGLAHRYTWSAHRESGFPFELATMEVDRRSNGVLVEWETASEQQLVGFNILRRRGDGEVVTINPVWIPALGSETRATSYSFLDTTAEPGVTYHYTVQGVTGGGLTSVTVPIETK